MKIWIVLRDSYSDGMGIFISALSSIFDAQKVIWNLEAKQTDSANLQYHGR